MWFSRKIKNRRLGRGGDVLDVKLRSSQVRATRIRFVALTLGILFGATFGLYCIWRAGEWALNELVYENTSFAIQQVEIQTDGSIAPDQLRRWSGVRVGENLLALDLARVKRDLELVPMIQSVSVERVLPGTLRIRVAEREPIAQVNVPRPRSGGGVEFIVFQIDAEGYVVQPLDPRQFRTFVEGQAAADPLPLMSGINLSELQPGRRIESTATRAALKLIMAFEGSPMAGLEDLRRIDVTMAEVLIVKTAHGSEITFGLDDFEGQLRRWQKVHEECTRLSKSIASLNLAVAENTPLRLVEASPVPPPKVVKPQRPRKRNV